MSQNVEPNVSNERVEAINAQTVDLAERRKVARQITEKAIADAASNQARKEQAANTEKFLMEQRRNVAQEIVDANLAKAEDERTQREGYRPTADQPVRPTTFVNPSGPNPQEKPVVPAKGWEWRQR
jgi:hypothetical protein